MLLYDIDFTQFNPRFELVATVRTVESRDHPNCPSCSWKYTVHDNFVLLWLCSQLLVVDTRTGYWGVWGRPPERGAQEGSGESPWCNNFSSVSLSHASTTWRWLKESYPDSRLRWWGRQSSQSPLTNCFNSPSLNALSRTKRSPVVTARHQHMPSGTFTSLSLIRHHPRALSQCLILLDL